MDLDWPDIPGDHIEDISYQLAVLRNRKRENARTPAETLIDRAELRKILNRIFRTVLSPRTSSTDAAREEMENHQAKESHRRDAAYSSIIGRHPVMPAAAVNPGAETTHTAQPELPEDTPTILSEQDNEGASALAADVVTEQENDASPVQESKRYDAAVEMIRARLADRVAKTKVKHELERDRIFAEQERASILAQLYESQSDRDEPSPAAAKAASKLTSTIGANLYVFGEDSVNGGHRFVDTQRIVIGYEQEPEQDAEEAVVEAESQASTSAAHIPQDDEANGKMNAAAGAASQADFSAKERGVHRLSKYRRTTMSEKTASILSQVGLIEEEVKRLNDATSSAAEVAGLPVPPAAQHVYKFEKDADVIGGQRVVGWRNGQRIQLPLAPSTIENAVEATLRNKTLQASWAEKMIEHSDAMEAMTARMAAAVHRVSVPPGDWCPEGLGFTPDDDASICAQMKWIEKEQHRRDNFSISAAEAAGLPIPEFHQILYEFGANQTNSSHHVVAWRHNERIGTQAELAAQCVGPQTTQNVTTHATALLSANETMGLPAYAGLVAGLTMLAFVAFGVLNGLLNDLIKRRTKAKEAKRLVAQKVKVQSILRANKGQIATGKARFLLQATGRATPEIKAKEQLAATMAPAPEVSDRETVGMLVNELIGFDYVRATRLLARDLIARRDAQRMGASFCGLVFIGSGQMAVRYAKSGNMAADAMSTFWKLKDFVCHPLFIIISAALGLCFAGADLVAWLDNREKNRLATVEEAKTVLTALAVAEAKPDDPDYYTDCNESCCESDDETEDEDVVYGNEDAPRSDSNATLVDGNNPNADDEKSPASAPPCGHIHLIDSLQTEGDQQRSIATRYKAQIDTITRRHNDQLTVIREAKLLLDDFAKRHELCQKEVTSAKEDLQNARNEVERLKASLEGQVRVQRSLILQREWASDALTGAKKEVFHLTEDSKAQIESWKLQARTFHDKALKWQAEGVTLGKKIEDIKTMTENKLKTAHDINDKTFASMGRLQTEVTRLKTELAAKTCEFERADRLLLKQDNDAQKTIGDLRLEVTRLEAQRSLEDEDVGAYQAEIQCLHRNNNELRFEVDDLKAEMVSREHHAATDISQIASLIQKNKDLTATHTKRTAELTAAHTQEIDKLNATLQDWHAKLHTAWKREAELNRIVEREHGLRQEAQETMWALQRVLSAKERDAAEVLREEADGVELNGAQGEDPDVSDVISEAESGSEFSVLSAPREDAESEEEDA
ncbi:hypothetical protein B0A48_01331 [Cryoendolithus antarcticus]|uniref:Uncharacterized protein n=1 Tax=Cryoendolithus antarcticus TaxID=1507870 RepID=A0A1V8TSY2_9PEZI|nr:hypothetical protein B0A48_01331 [Cryoendolithus antarcticus]